ncbi:hypothetical protein PSI22_21345, partial [Xenorhabdus sp. XENO-7]
SCATGKKISVLFIQVNLAAQHRDPAAIQLNAGAAKRNFDIRFRHLDGAAANPQGDIILRFIQLSTRAPFAGFRLHLYRVRRCAAGQADSLGQTALLDFLGFIAGLQGQRPVTRFHHQTLVIFHRGVHVLLRMQRQLFTAFRILKQQFVIPFSLVGLGAERHLGFAARQRPRRDVAGVV